jgi:hypothetical protein
LEITTLGRITRALLLDIRCFLLFMMVISLINGILNLVETSVEIYNKITYTVISSQYYDIGTTTQCTFE